MKLQSNVFIGDASMMLTHCPTCTAITMCLSTDGCCGSSVLVPPVMYIIYITSAVCKRINSGLCVLAVLANWLPGRSAAGIRQAYNANCTQAEGRLAAIIKQHGWPSELLGVLKAWPGPTADGQQVCVTSSWTL